MSRKIAVFSDDRFKFFEAKEAVERKTALGRYCLRADGQGVDEVPLNLTPLAPGNGSALGFYDGVLGRGNVLPFSRQQHPMRKPNALHYEIPAVGDHRLRWLYSFMTPEGKELSERDPVTA